MTRPKSSSVRLQKVLADRGLCSRREADSWIADGLVKVNGVVAVPGTRVEPLKDQIVVRGKGLPPGIVPETVTLAMHKPKGVICSRADPHHSRTVFDLLPRKLRQARLLCAGRLDKDSEGLLILTSDGDLAHRIMHPSHQVTKRYRVTLHRPLEPGLIPKLVQGHMVEGEHLKFDKLVALGRKSGESYRLEVHLRHGRKREIRRLLRFFGYHVNRLQRFQIGRLNLRGLPLGACRPLRDTEIRTLFD